MRAMLLTDTQFPEGGNGSGSTFTHMLAARAQLEGLEISWDRVVTDGTHPTAAEVMAKATALNNPIDFILCPRVSSTKYKYLIDDATVTIPIIILTMNSLSPSQLSATPGISGTVTGNADAFATSVMSSSVWQACQGTSWTLASPATSLITSQATSPLTGGANTIAGGLTLAWYVSRASGKGMVVSSLQGDIQPMLAYWLQELYNHGDLSKAQINSMRKLPVVIDLDHQNGPYFNSVSGLIKRWTNLLPANAISWGGGMDNPDTNISAMSAEVNAELSTNTKLRFNYHEHDSTRQAVTGTWPYASQGGTLADNVTKTQQDTAYATVKALWNAQGLTFHMPGYLNPGTNRWNEATLALGSPEVSLASSPGNDVSKAGYGFTIIRYDDVGTASRKGPNMALNMFNHHKRREYMRSMTLVSSRQLCNGLDTPYSTIADWRRVFQYYLWATHYGVSLFMHDYDFKDTQNPLTANTGVEIMNQLLSWKTYAKDTTLFWANPVDYSVVSNRIGS